MRQCAKVTIQPACRIVNNAKEQKGGVSMLPLTDLNLGQGFLLFCVSNFVRFLERYL
jgi:hypothetical protein